MRNRVLARAGLVLALVSLALNVLMWAGPSRPPKAHAQAGGGGIIPLGAVINQAAPVASTGIFKAALGHALSPTQDGSVLRIAATLALTGPLYVTETCNGTTQTIALNDAVSITQYHAWTGVWGVRKFDASGNAITYDFVMATTANGSVPELRVEEIIGPAD